jgi:predicted nuclease of predicted toxin-antitoxin system
VSVPPPDIRLILDQGVPRDAAAVLREAGFECDHVGELGLSRAQDTGILELARQRQAVVVTLDTDFHAILAVSMATGPSVIRLRLQGLDGDRVANLVADLVGQFAVELGKGRLLTVKRRKTTCHMLPIATDA